MDYIDKNKIFNRIDNLNKDDMVFDIFKKYGITDIDGIKKIVNDTINDDNNIILKRIYENKKNNNLLDKTDNAFFNKKRKLKINDELNDVNIKLIYVNNTFIIKIVVISTEKCFIKIVNNKNVVLAIFNIIKYGIKN
jgi:hypothetical protein